MKYVPVDFSNTELDIPLGTGEVEPGTRYIVCVRARNKFGIGVYGEPQIVKTGRQEVIQKIRKNFYHMKLLVFQVI